MTSKSFLVDKAIFNRDTLLRASFSFSDRCYVSIESASDQNWSVSLDPKTTPDDDQIQNFEGEFRNSLVNEAYRVSLIEKVQSTKEFIIAKALFSAEGAAPEAGTQENLLDNEQDDLSYIDDELDSYLDDPLGIAIPWEEKHNKKDSTE